MNLFWCVRLSRAQIAGSLVWLFVFLAGATFANESDDSSSVVENRRDLFANEQLCDAYKSFLLGEEFADGSECDSIARVIIASQEASDTVYLERISRLTSESSPLGSVATLLKVSRSGGAINIFNQAGITGRLVAIPLAESGDVERATLYSHLIHSMQVAAARVSCGDSAICSDISSSSSIENAFGSSYAGLDGFRPDRLLLCLLRTDNYRLSVLELLQSPRFGVCIRRT